MDRAAVRNGKVPIRAQAYVVLQCRRRIVFPVDVPMARRTSTIAGPALKRRRRIVSPPDRRERRNAKEPEQ